MRLALKEAITILYILQSLGINPTFPSSVIGDNPCVTISATSVEAALRKKHVTLSFQKENVMV